MRNFGFIIVLNMNPSSSLNKIFEDERSLLAILKDFMTLNIFWFIFYVPGLIKKFSTALSSPLHFHYNLTERFSSEDPVFPFT